jgi:hypothetical protein
MNLLPEKPRTPAMKRSIVHISPEGMQGGPSRITGYDVDELINRIQRSSTNTSALEFAYYV